MEAGRQEVDGESLQDAKSLKGADDCSSYGAVETGKERDLDRVSGLFDRASRDAEKEENLPPRKIVIVIMIAVVQGYTLIGPLQHAFKVRLGIGDTGHAAEVFTQAVALVQWGKFFMALGQNWLFSCFTPMQRVFMSMTGMMIGATIPPLIVYFLGHTWIGWVVISFSLIGLSLGVFECTFLNVITPLGPLTKAWAIMGFPAAFFIVNVIGMTLTSFGVPIEALFWYIVFGMFVGLGTFTFQIVPALRTDSAAHLADPRKKAAIMQSLEDWPAWMPRLFPLMVANVVGHFVMEGALPANFNAFNAPKAPLFGRGDTHGLMEKGRFFVVFFVFVGLGDMLSRRTGYCFHMERYRYYLLALVAGFLCSCLGLYLTTIGIGVTAWASAFVTFWGQGFNYAICSKYIDRYLPREHNLAAYSFWIFAGSSGAIAGSVGVDVLRSWICRGETYPYLCLPGTGPTASFLMW